MFHDQLERDIATLQGLVKELRERLDTLERIHDYGRIDFASASGGRKVLEHAIQIGDTTYALNDVLRALIAYDGLTFVEDPPQPARLYAIREGTK